MPQTLHFPTPSPVPPPAATIALPPPPPAPHVRPVALSAQTIWQEAEGLLRAGLSVVDVARECDLPKGQVSALKFRLQDQRGA